MRRRIKFYRIFKPPIQVVREFECGRREIMCFRFNFQKRKIANRKKKKHALSALLLEEKRAEAAPSHFSVISDKNRVLARRPDTFGNFLRSLHYVTPRAMRTPHPVQIPWKSVQR